MHCILNNLETDIRDESAASETSSNMLIPNLFLIHYFATYIQSRFNRQMHNLKFWAISWFLLRPQALFTCPLNPAYLIAFSKTAFMGINLGNQHWTASLCRRLPHHECPSVTRDDTRGGGGGVGGNCLHYDFFLACQLRGQSCTLMILIPLPHYNNFATTFLRKEKTCAWTPSNPSHEGKNMSE